MGITIVRFHLISVQLVFFLVVLLSFLHFRSHTRCSYKAFPSSNSSLISSIMSITSSGAIERHLLAVTFCIIFAMTGSSISDEEMKATKCRMSFSLSLSNLHPPSLKHEECHTKCLFVQFLF